MGKCNCFQFIELNTPRQCLAPAYVLNDSPAFGFKSQCDIAGNAKTDFPMGKSLGWYFWNVPDSNNQTEEIY